MKKIIKMVCMLVAVVLLSTCVCACGMFSDDQRGVIERTIMKAGDIEVSMFSFNTLYNNAYNSMYNQYYYYIVNGQITESYIMEMAVSQAYNQLQSVYAVVAQHIEDAENDSSLVFENNLVGKIPFAQYITQEEATYCAKATKYSIINTMIASLNALIAEDFELDEVEDDDTVREDPEVRNITSYSDEHYKLSTETVEEILFKYSTDTAGNFDLDWANFTSSFASLASDSQQMIDLLASYNDRISGNQEKMTMEQLVGYRNSAYNEFELSTAKYYSMTGEEYAENSLREMVVNCLLSHIEREYNRSKIEANTQTLLENLEAYWTGLKENTMTDYIMDAESYEEFIVALSDTSYILNVPAQYEGKYVFVKNLLIPFNTAQAAEIKTLSTAIKSTEEEEYFAFRLDLANDILAEHFTDQDKPLERMFEVTTVGEKEQLQIIPASTLGVALSTVDSGEAFLQLMYDYNTDVGQHTSFYDYVVNVDPDTDFTSKWVDEFQKGAEELYAEWTASPDTALRYKAVVTDYGVHIIYLEEAVEEQDIQFDSIDKFYTTETVEYKLLADYYGQVSDILFEDLYEKALDNQSVEMTKYFSEWLEDRGLSIE